MDHDDAQFSRDLVNASPRLRRFARSLARNRPDSEDLVQTTLLKAWKARQSFRPGTNLAAWLACILRNECYTAAGRRKRDNRLLDEYPRATAPAPPQEYAVALHELACAVGLLRAEDREVFVLVTGGASYEDAAARLGQPQGTVKSRLFRVRQKLAELFPVDLAPPRRRKATGDHVQPVPAAPHPR